MINKMCEYHLTILMVITGATALMASAGLLHLWPLDLMGCGLILYGVIKREELRDERFYESEQECPYGRTE